MLEFVLVSSALVAIIALVQAFLDARSKREIELSRELAAANERLFPSSDKALAAMEELAKTKRDNEGEFKWGVGKTGLLMRPFAMGRTPIIPENGDAHIATIKRGLDVHIDVASGRTFTFGGKTVPKPTIRTPGSAPGKPQRRRTAE